MSSHYLNLKAWWRPTVVLLVVLVGVLWVAPAGAQPAQNGIANPESGAVVSGVVIISGTATGDSFLRYELAFNRGVGWIVFAEGDRPVVADTLAIWDTTVGAPRAPVFPDGAYQLRLRVVRQDYNYDEYFVTGLTVANGETTPTPTPTATATDEAAGTDGAPTPRPGGTAMIEVGRPTVLPSLTPFPSPSPQATPVNVVSADGSRPDAGADGAQRQGLLQRITAIDTGPFRQAFWQGVTLAFYAFVILAAYLLLRGGLRRLWRTFWARVGERGEQ